MSIIKKDIEQIVESSNTIVAKLEILRALEEHKEVIVNEIKKTKEKLEKDEITKFTYATMQEVNQKNLDDNINHKKVIWNDIAEIVNGISDKLNSLKETFSKSAELTDGAKLK